MQLDWDNEKLGISQGQWQMESRYELVEVEKPVVTLILMGL